MSVAVANRRHPRAVAAPILRTGRRVRAPLLVTAAGEAIAGAIAAFALHRTNGPIPVALVACVAVIGCTRALAGALRGSLPMVATALLVGALRVTVLFPAVHGVSNQRPAAALFTTGCVPVIGALLAQVVLPRVRFGRRDALIPGLLASAIGAA